MASVELILLVVGLVGGSIILVAAGMVLPMMYPNLKLIIGDLARLFGFAAKWIRKTSLASELEGSLNSFVKQYNSEFISPFLPECDIQWITDTNQKTLIEPGKVIVKLSFEQDHDLNHYNAASLYVRAGLLPRAKPFLGNLISRALDLVVVSDLLRKARRSALTIFNDKFNEEPPDCREVFYRVEDIDEKGFFRRILLQEYQLFGEVIGEKAPRPEYLREAEKFLDWLHSLATREGEEQSILKFVGDHIRIGVLLIAKEDTYKKYGLEPYLRRAHAYASDDFATIYLISRGHLRGKIAKQIASELIALGYCEQLTRTPDIYVGTKGNEDVITCIPLKVDLVGVIQAAWKRLRDDFDNGRDVEVEVKVVTQEAVVVDAYGLGVDMILADLSELNITDARKYFRPEQKLLVKIRKLSEENQSVHLSNVGTVTDPKRLVDEFAEKANASLEATVAGYSEFDGYETGLFVHPQGFVVKGYVPRKHATYSRFVQLSLKYPLNTRIRIRPISFAVEHNSYLCGVDGLEDPWTRMERYKIGGLYSVVIRQITEKYLTCELEEGLEGSVYVEEVSWEASEVNAEKIRQHKVGQSVQVKLLNFDPQRRYIWLSIKRSVQSSVEKWFEDHRDQVIKARVVIIKTNGVAVEFLDTKVQGFLPLREVAWSYCDSLQRMMSPGQIVTVKPTLYNPRFNNISVSIKATQRNEYDAFKQAHKPGSEVEARVEFSQPSHIDVCIPFGNSLEARGYIHKSELSNQIYVSDENIGAALDKGKTYPVIVKRFDDNSRIVEVSRKLIFQKDHAHLEYGKTYTGKVLSDSRGKIVVYGERLEGRLVKWDSRLIGQEIEVVIARTGEWAGEVEVHPSS